MQQPCGMPYGPGAAPGQPCMMPPPGAPGMPYGPGAAPGAPWPGAGKGAWPGGPEWYGKGGKGDWGMFEKGKGQGKGMYNPDGSMGGGKGPGWDEGCGKGAPPLTGAEPWMDVRGQWHQGKGG